MSTTEPKHPSTELDEERVRALIDSLTHLSPASQHLIEVMKGPDQFDDSRAALTGERRRIGTRQPRRSKEPAVLLEVPQGESLPGLLTPRLTAPRRLKVTAHSALVADYATGLTQVQIAEKYGLHVQTVRKRLIAAGVDTRARLRVLTDEDLWAARAAIDDGASVRETARGLGVAHTTITRLLARHHEAPKSPLRTTKAGPRTSTTSVRIRRSPLRTTSETPSDQGNVKANQPQHRNAGAGPWVPK